MKHALDYNSIKNFYNNHTDCWGDDLFSRMTTAYIDKYVYRKIVQLPKHRVILNAGSGGKEYKTNAEMYHLDIAENTLKGLNNAYVGNIINMPFENNMFDVVICVGTVINYCDADRALGEIRRVSKKNATLIIEYERSESGLIDKLHRGVDCMVFHHNYFGESHDNYLYSDSYVCNLLEKNGYVIEERESFNATIPFFEMFLPDTVAHLLTIFEPILQKIGFVAKYSHNTIMTCRLNNKPI